MGAAKHFAKDSSALFGESEPEVDNVLTANPSYIGLGRVWRAGFGMQVFRDSSDVQVVKKEGW